jgi:hypothetical protein
LGFSAPPIRDHSGNAKQDGTQNINWAGQDKPKRLKILQFVHVFDSAFCRALDDWKAQALFAGSTPSQFVWFLCMMESRYIPKMHCPTYFLVWRRVEP